MCHQNKQKTHILQLEAVQITVASRDGDKSSGCAWLGYELGRIPYVDSGSPM